MSFALTTHQIRQRTKTVTRRVGWRFLKRGDLLQPVVKAQGLKKGERVEPINGPLRVVAVAFEPLDRLVKVPAYGLAEVQNEGFPDLTPAQFLDMFCLTHGCRAHDVVTRIQFEYVETPDKDNE